MIYFLQAGDEGPVKIGVAGSLDHVEQRRTSMQTYRTEPVRLLGTIEGGHAQEKALHRAFDHVRLREGGRELFEPDPDLLDIATSAEKAALRLTLREAWERWIAKGLIERDGSITDAGIEHFAVLDMPLKDTWGR